jgi:hypothetical protein
VLPKAFKRQREPKPKLLRRLQVNVRLDVTGGVD